MNGRIIAQHERNVVFHFSKTIYTETLETMGASKSCPNIQQRDWLMIGCGSTKTERQDSFLV